MIDDEMLAEELEKFLPNVTGNRFIFPKTLLRHWLSKRLNCLRYSSGHAASMTGGKSMRKKQ